MIIKFLARAPNNVSRRVGNSLYLLFYMTPVHRAALKGFHIRYFAFYISNIIINRNVTPFTCWQTNDWTACSLPFYAISDGAGDASLDLGHVTDCDPLFRSMRSQTELGARLSAQDRELQQLRRQLADKDKAILLQQSQFDDAIKALATSHGRVSLSGGWSLRMVEWGSGCTSLYSGVGQNGCVSMCVCRGCLATLYGWMSLGTLHLTYRIQA